MGILGLGYLGKQLCKQSLPCISWGSYHRNPSLTLANAPPLRLKFQWENPQTWGHLPEKAVTLILTIPPVLKDPLAETERLIHWGEWMRRKRPQLKQMIYISSTSVYPDQNRIWKESDVLEPDSLAGKLRLATEKILARFFDLFVIRPGGIYGPGRNIIQRVMDGKSISRSYRPVHRIHVNDLACIVELLVQTPGAPRCLNAVDQTPSPSFEILEWFLQKKWMMLPVGIAGDFQENKAEAQRDPIKRQRLIANHKLLHEMNYSYKFPSFREGLENIFGYSAH